MIEEANIVDGQWIRDHCRDRGRYPLIFDKNFGADIKIPNHPEYFVEVHENSTVKIKITTWRGLAIDAVHYYAQLYADQPSLCSRSEDGQVVSHYGYICEEWQQMSKEITSNIGGEWKIEILRTVTEEDIKKDPHRWDGYEVGWTTNAFDTEAEVLDIARKVAEYRFSGWNIVQE